MVVWRGRYFMEIPQFFTICNICTRKEKRTIAINTGKECRMKIEGTESKDVSLSLIYFHHIVKTFGKHYK